MPGNSVGNGTLMLCFIFTYIFFQEMGQKTEALEKRLEKLERSCEYTMVFFSAYQQGSSISTEINGVGDVTYNHIVENTGNGLGGGGYFNTPVAGLYSFSLSGSVYNYNFQTKVGIYVNEREEFSINSYDFNGQSLTAISHTWFAYLNKGDSVHIKVTEGKLVTNSHERVTFSGHLVKLY